MHRPNEPQVYPVCFQANVKSSGTLKPKDTVRFPDAYNLNDNFKSFNLYWGDDYNKFTPPGPAVFDRRAASPAPAPSPPTSSTPPTFSTQPVLIVPPSQSSDAASAGSVPAPQTTSTPGHCKRR